MTRTNRLWIVAPAAVASLIAFAAWAGPRFIRSEPVNGEPVVEDRVTGLVWQGCQAGESGPACANGSEELYTWQQAMDYCNGLSWSGKSDWVFPDIKELRSIVDNKATGDWIDEDVFPRNYGSGGPGVYWSSTVYAGDTSKAWIVGFDEGSVREYSKDDKLNVRCVRR